MRSAFWGGGGFQGGCAAGSLSPEPRICSAERQVWVLFLASLAFCQRFAIIQKSLAQHSDVISAATLPSFLCLFSATPFSKICLSPQQMSLPLGSPPREPQSESSHWLNFPYHCAYLPINLSQVPALGQTSFWGGPSEQGRHALPSRCMRSDGETDGERWKGSFWRIGEEHIGW